MFVCHYSALVLSSLRNQRIDYEHDKHFTSIKSQAGFADQRRQFGQLEYKEIGTICCTPPTEWQQTLQVEGVVYTLMAFLTFTYALYYVTTLKMYH